MSIGDGYMIVVGNLGITERDTIQCCHCNMHYIIQPGSGKRRGWCYMCGAATCGAVRCNPCIPFERKLEQQEAYEQSLRSMLG